MKYRKFRISFYTGPSVYDALLRREYVIEEDMEQANVRAAIIAKECSYRWWDIVEVKE